MKISKAIKIPKKLSNNQAVNYFESWGLINILKNTQNTYGKNKEAYRKLITSKLPYGPELNDLYRLHSTIILNKRLTVLEFGSGWSSLIIAHALNVNKKKYEKQSKKIRKLNKFELHILENEKKFLNISKKRIQKFLGKKNNVHFHFSNCKMAKFEGKICTEYEKIPLINPDFIYLDGPDQLNIKNSINGFSVKHHDMMPMVSDILKIESFLIPGTIIIADGRTANSLFLKNHFVRNWIYEYDKKNDQNIFFLNDNSLGPINDRQKKFYLNVKIIS
jgi:hypothetical protein